MARFNMPSKSQGEVQRSSKKSSVLSTIDNILQAIAEAKHSKAYAEKFRDVLRKLINTLSGVDVNFVRQAEYYNDLKETLTKIHAHVIDSTTRGKWAKLMMAKRDQKIYEEISIHVDNLIGRIIFSFAQRVQLRKNSPSPPSTTRELQLPGSEGSIAGSDIEVASTRSDSACSCVNSDSSYTSSDVEYAMPVIGR